MMRLTSVITASFCAAHRLMDPQFGKCQYIHGHNWQARVTLEYAPSDGVEILDFAEAKARLRDWIDDSWDHAFIVQKNDEQSVAAIGEFNKAASRVENGVKAKVFTLSVAPTCEALASFLFHHVLPMLFNVAETGIKKVEVTESGDWSTAGVIETDLHWPK
jgi:6-pyruvoyltetrahydropterin/6-carboxytetrahydropterin synthase